MLSTGGGGCGYRGVELGMDKRVGAEVGMVGASLYEYGSTMFSHCQPALVKARVGNRIRLNLTLYLP